MILLDTATLTLLWNGHPRVTARAEQTEDDFATTVITWIEVLQGRFASIFKAADADQLLLAQRWLDESERYLSTYEIVPVDDAAAAQFDKLRQNKKLKKIRRGDLLIACIALAHRATLATRNVRDFRLVPGLKVENW